MNEIQKPSNNLGGLLQIWAFEYKAVWFTGRSAALDPANAFKFYFSPESMEFKEPPQITSAGTHYLTEVSGFAPNNNETILSMITEMQGKRFVVIFQDGNENYLAAGTHLFPLRMNAVLDPGKSVSDLSGYKITFAGQTISRAFFIDNPF